MVTLDIGARVALEAAVSHDLHAVWCAALWRGEITTAREIERLMDTTRARIMGTGAEVHIICRPAPNEIDIGGEAVALDCQGRK